MLSGGMQQTWRSRALANDPKILRRRPFGALDNQTRG
jgi:ABC-type nitrate/sulfonate/bicarbonate transport system ATPase subunit